MRAETLLRSGPPSFSSCFLQKLTATDFNTDLFPHFNRLDVGNFSWGSEAIARKARIIDTVYNASNNEWVRTKTLVKNAIISIDAAPFRQWYEAHYALPIGRKKGAKLTEADEALFNKKRSKKTQKKYDDRKKTAKVY